MTIEAIRAARARMKNHLRRTPMLNAPLLDKRIGRQIFVKAESLQVTGSFKARGAWAAISALPQGTRGVLAMSSGNHAQGIAWAAAAHGIAATILMPMDAPEVKAANTRAYGGEVILYDRATTDRDALAARLAAERGLVLIPPYDHPEVIAGQGTVGLEIAEQAAELGISEADVLVNCGGGGLSAGIALALQAEAPRLRLRTVEPQGFDDMARSLAKGERLRNASPFGSICDAILTPTPGQMTFPILQSLAGPGLVVSDVEALEAVALAYRAFRIVAEPGGAVALAAALFSQDLPDKVIVTITGGNADTAMFIEALSRPSL